MAACAACPGAAAASIIRAAPDETPGAGQRFARLAGERGAAAGAEPHDGDLRLCGKAEPAAEKLHRFRGGEPLALRRTADDDRHRARFRRGGDLFFKSSGAAGGLRYEIRRADAPEHGGVEFPGKRPLHCENVRRRQAASRQARSESSIGSTRA